MIIAIILFATRRICVWYSRFIQGASHVEHTTFHIFFNMYSPSVSATMQELFINSITLILMKKILSAFFGLFLLSLAHFTFAQTTDLDQDGRLDHEDPEVIISTNQYLPAGEYTFQNLIITNNATLTLAGDQNSPNEFKGVKITAQNITVNSGAKISADGQGCRTTCPGTLGSSGGAGYGGKGGDGRNAPGSAGLTYGSALYPTDLGSGTQYTGGGAIYLEVSNILINDGTISANGNIRGWSGSGGSILVNTNQLAGNGLFSASGVSGNSLSIAGYAGGGGGRIALHYNTSSFAGQTFVAGGSPGFGSHPGQPGTIAYIDKENLNLIINNSFQFLVADSPLSFNKIILEDGAQVTSEDSVVITTNEFIMRGNSYYTSSANQHLETPSISLDNTAHFLLNGEETLTVDNLHLKGDSVLETPSGVGYDLNIPTITIDIGASISATNKGFADTSGPGTGGYRGGYGHGGKGGSWAYNSETSSGGLTYGSETEPVLPGNGPNTYNSRGGGAIHIISDLLIVNGTVTSDGGRQRGSGGSIFIETTTLSGVGRISANGAENDWFWPYSGGGGGGRIAVYYSTKDYSGTIETLGGRGYYGKNGESGTVVFEQQNVAPTLSFIDGVGYATDIKEPGVHPNKGVAGQDPLEFKVNYMSEKNVPPTSISTNISHLNTFNDEFYLEHISFSESDQSHLVFAKDSALDYMPKFGSTFVGYDAGLFDITGGFDDTDVVNITFIPTDFPCPVAPATSM